MRMRVGLVVVFCANLCLAETIHFLPQEGEWHDTNVWDAGRTPQLGDIVVIDAGRHCTIAPFGLAVATSIIVHESGILTLDQETLVLGSGNPDIDVTILLDGRIEFKDNYAFTPPARIVPNGGWVKFEGIGDLYASRASGPEFQGRLRCCASNSPCGAYGGKGFVIGQNVTVRGSLHLHACLVLNGTWIIDHPDDKSEIGMPKGSYCGECPNPITISGSGQFILRDGQLKFISATMNPDQSPRIILEGGSFTTETKGRFKVCCNKS